MPDRKGRRGKTFEILEHPQAANKYFSTQLDRHKRCRIALGKRKFGA